MFEAFAQDPNNPLLQIDSRGLPLISFGELLTFLVRLFFFIAGIAALLYGLRGALAWITSGGGKDEVDAARDKIVAAVTGVFIIIIVLSIVVALEQFVFNRQLCFGLSCPATIPQLQITPLPDRPGGDTDVDVGVGTAEGEDNNNGADTQNGAANSLTPTATDAQLPATGGGRR